MHTYLLSCTNYTTINANYSSAISKLATARDSFSSPAKKPQHFPRQLNHRVSNRVSSSNPVRYPVRSSFVSNLVSLLLRAAQQAHAPVNRRQLTSDPRRSLRRFLRVIILHAGRIRAISTLDGEPMNSVELFQRATLVTSTFLLRIVSREKGIR